MSPSPNARASEAGPRLEYQPALDGVRAVAVTLVLLFHAGFGWMSGGYVGVSVFFTLSGYLITSLLLREHLATGRVSLSNFYRRRVQRLLPASLLCLVAVAVIARIGWFGAIDSLRRDLVAAALQVANWNALTGSVSYADMVARTMGRVGPVDHFWSLAVEEQFYWLWPLVFVLLLRGGRWRVARAWITGLAVAGIAGAFLVAARWGADATYWSTPARLGEILIGAALAMWLHGRMPRRRWWFLAAGGALVVLACAVWWPASGGPAYRGWLPVFALASAALVAGLQVPSVVCTVLSTRPLVALGRVSYGVYLFHWPIFVVLDRSRVHVGGWWLFAVRAAVTLVVAALSARVLELPVRRSRQLRVGVIGPAALAAAVVVVLVVTPSATGALDEASLPSAFATMTTVTPSTSAAPASIAVSASSTSVAKPSRPLRVLLVGDSTMVGLARGVVDWAAANPSRMVVASVARVGCGLIRHSRMLGDGEGHFDFRCEQVWSELLPAVVRSGAPDVALVMVAIPDAAPRVWTKAEGSLQPSDSRYVARLRADYESTLFQLRAAGVHKVLWVLPPLPAHKWLGWMQASVSASSWKPMLDEIVSLGERFPDVVSVLRFDDWLSANEPRNGVWRYDGLHFDEPSASAIVQNYFADKLLTLVP